jgi:hypothetical protein
MFRPKHIARELLQSYRSQSGETIDALLSTARSCWSFSATLAEPSVARRSPSSQNFVRNSNPGVLALPLSTSELKTAPPKFSRRITSTTYRASPIPTANFMTLSAWSMPNYANTSTAKVSIAC